MRISDWSSDVCSSDLAKPQVIGVVPIETVVAAVRAKVLPASDEPPFTRTVAPVTKSSVSSRSVARDHPLADATKMPFSTGAVWFFTSTRSPLSTRTPSMTLRPERSEEHTSELQSLMRLSYAVFCLKKTHYTQQIQTIYLSYYI